MGDPNFEYDRLVALKYNLYTQNPSRPKEFSIGDEHYLQFTEVDCSAASIHDITEGTDNTKHQFDVHFVEAAETILAETWQVRQQKFRIQERLAREERLAKLQIKEPPSRSATARCAPGRPLRGIGRLISPW